MDIVPKTAKRAIKMAGVTKVSFEFRGTGQELLVAVSMELPQPLGLIGSFMPIDPNAETTATMKKNVERMVGATEGACQIL